MPEVAGLVRQTSGSSLALPTLLTQTQQTLAELERLLVQLRGVWLLGGTDSTSPEQSRLSPLEARP
jgi:phospholipid/cholesterol/gamma-HCH transport system substrate-binding protein